MVNSFIFLKYQIKNEILYITLNNPKKHNALNPILIRELEKAFTKAQKNKKIKVICLKARGKNFCSGADLKWMSSAKNMTPNENYRDMLKLVRMYTAILKFKGPVVAQVQGLALGGGVGLACAADVVICEHSTVFRMPEVELGLIPGIITPIVRRKIGIQAFNYYSKTAQPITAQKSLELNLASLVTTKKNLNNKIVTVIRTILSHSLNDFIKDKAEINIKQPITTAVLKKWALASSKKRQSKKFQNLK